MSRQSSPIDALHISIAHAMPVGLTSLEKAIVEILEKCQRENSLTTHSIKFKLQKYGFSYGPKGKSIVGMAIGRMKKKGIVANYNALQR